MLKRYRNNHAFISKRMHAAQEAGGTLIGEDGLEVMAGAE